MNELIPLQPQTINGNAVETVSARELHAFLESKQDFSTWIKNRIETVSPSKKRIFQSLLRIRVAYEQRQSQRRYRQSSVVGVGLVHS